ncbi:MAG: ABC transporter permease subunit [Clostridia bacterium]|nr:ABC transporter permease subunit [Clostridia bacterium]
MDQNSNKHEKIDNVFVRVGKTLWNWTRRMFMGASKDLANQDIFEVEKLESPSKLAVKAFFRRKIAVVALCVLIAMFLFVFVGPVIFPMDMNYTDPLQMNLAPVMSMRSVPRALRGNIRSINGFSNFTVGVSNDNNLYVWGATEDALTGVDMADFPAEITEGNVAYAAAGRDHIIAITTDGKIVGWGDKSLAQYGENKNTANPALVGMPKELIDGTIDVSKVDSLTCGLQVTALVIDGKLYMWGNGSACLNLADTLKKEYTGVQEVIFSNYYAVVLFKDGTIACEGGYFNFASASSSKGTKVSNFTSYLATKKVVNITATDNCFGFLLSDGEVLVQSASRYNEDKIPTIPAGEKVVNLVSGTRHFVALTDAGKAYAWGHNDYGQSKINGVECDAVYAGSYQTYLAEKNDDTGVSSPASYQNGVGYELEDSYGLRGYPFGTDNRGRDTLTRIIHGGKMTMTVGAVAVIVSSIIAIIIGCLSGYFGGWVDMLLMRITEIFSAIPFLPFAMMLSYVIRNYDISENMRIFIIMIILGVLSWTGLARMIRGQVLAEREKEFVTAAKSMGVKESKIAFKHILPNIISVILVSMALDFAGCLLTESSLSYLGFGVQQPRPTWGNMLNGANNSIVIQNYWWQWLFPSIFLAIATISINIIGDTIRDVLDPKSSQEK